MNRLMRIVLLSLVVLGFGGCNSGRAPGEPTPKDEEPMPVDGIDPESLEP